MRRRILPFMCALGVLCSAAPAVLAGPPDAPAKRSPVLAALQAELDRSFKALKAQDPPAYFLGYTVTDTQRADVSGSNGALLTSTEGRNRWLEVSVRTGSYTLDNSHKVGERQQANGGPGTSVPVDDDAEVLGRALWLETRQQDGASSPGPLKLQER